MNSRAKYLLLAALLSILYLEATAYRRSYRRFKQEVKLIQCLCTAQTPVRMQRIQCMERFSDFNKSGYRFYQIVQYCGYFAYKTNFGYTMRMGINIPDYNPWQHSPDLNTNKICGYTRYRPGVPSPPYIGFVTGKGWVIAKCIMNMANMDAGIGDYMYDSCCRS